MQTETQLYTKQSRVWLSWTPCYLKFISFAIGCYSSLINQTPTFSAFICYLKKFWNSGVELYQIQIYHWILLFFNHLLPLKSTPFVYQLTKSALRVLILLYLSATSWHPWFPASKWVMLAPAEQMPCCRDRWCLQSRQMYCQLLSGFSYIFGRTFSFLPQCGWDNCRLG